MTAGHVHSQLCVFSGHVQLGRGAEPQSAEFNQDGASPVQSDKMRERRGLRAYTRGKFQASNGILNLKKKSQFVYLFLAALGICCCTRTFSSCGVQASHCSGFSFCRAQALGAWASVAAVHGLVALQDVGSFWPRNQTGIPCIARQIPNHRTTKKCLAIVLCCSFLFSFSSTLIFLPRVSSLTHPTWEFWSHFCVFFPLTLQIQPITKQQPAHSHLHQCHCHRRCV